MQSRKWQLTINNPAEKGITHDVLRESLAKFTGMVYWCMCDETGSEGTYHTHVYFVLRTPTVHTVVENRFPSIHRENVKGTSQQNRDYVLKDGEKYGKQPDGSYNYTDGSGKTHTGVNHTVTFEEWGEMPIERQGAGPFSRPRRSPRPAGRASAVGPQGPSAPSAAPGLLCPYRRMRPRW